MKIKEGNLKTIEEFEFGRFYWARYNCGFLIVKCGLGSEPSEDKSTWVLRGETGNHPLPEALVVFAGGIYGPIQEPYDTQ